MPPKRTHVILVDQTELANGWATPVPHDTIVWSRRSGLPGSDFIGDTDDWLRLVLTHEFTHIVHLDRSESWARAVRADLRSRGARVSESVPAAVADRGTRDVRGEHADRRRTAACGRFPRSIVDEAARSRTLEPIDRVNGGLTDWPNGDGAYALRRRFPSVPRRIGSGPSRSRSCPRRPHGVCRTRVARVRAHLRSVARQPVARTTRRRWSRPRGRPRRPPLARGSPHHDYNVSGPRFDRPSCPTCPLDIVTIRAHAGRISVAEPGRARRLARRARSRGAISDRRRPSVSTISISISRRCGGTRASTAISAPESRADGRVRQLTREARLLDPDLSPDGGTLAAVAGPVQASEISVLVRLKPDAARVGLEADSAEPWRPASAGQRRTTVRVPDVASGFSRTVTIDTLIAEPDTQFNAPRWSPDGRLIAVERHRLGSLSEIVVVDVAARIRCGVIAPSTLGRSVTPAWRPDGRCDRRGRGARRATVQPRRVSAERRRPRDT